MTKLIRYDPITQDFELTCDGEFIGYAATRDDAERVLDQYVYEKLRRQNELQPVTEEQRDAAPLMTPRRVAPDSIFLSEDDTPTPAPIAPTPATDKPITRIAEPASIADAASVAYAVAAMIPDARERDRRYAAITKAVVELMAGAIPRRDGLGWAVPSRTQRGATYTVVAGMCPCKASVWCWHLSAADLADMLLDEERSIDAEYAAYHEFAA